jgi:hypothetical protein
MWERRRSGRWWWWYDLEEQTGRAERHEGDGGEGDVAGRRWKD